MLIGIEQEVTQHLRNRLLAAGITENDCKVEVIPDDSAQSVKMLHPNCNIWIRFDGEDIEIIGFTAIVMTRSLRDHNGAYAMIDFVKKSFFFCLIPNMGLTRIARVRFAGKTQEDIWAYEVQFSLVAQNIL
jgi:hypothetical protein